VCIIEFHGPTTEKELRLLLTKLIGSLFQRPPLMCSVKRNLRIRNIYSIDLIEFDGEGSQALFKVSCEAGTYIRTLCTHIGLLLGCGAHMKELRRIRSGNMNENSSVTLHDLLDSYYIFETKGDDSFLRKVIQPLESLLVSYPRIIVKDSSVNALCYGAQLTIPGVLRYDDGIDVGKDVVLVTTKGEAVALAEAKMATSEILTVDHGVVCKTKRVIMERDLYPKRWSFNKEIGIISDDE
jgi:H/ACA ribonucleoprotein complex subunit 4